MTAPPMELRRWDSSPASLPYLAPTSRLAPASLPPDRCLAVSSCSAAATLLRLLCIELPASRCSYSEHNHRSLFCLGPCPYLCLFFRHLLPLLAHRPTLLLPTRGPFVSFGFGSARTIREEPYPESQVSSRRILPSTMTMRQVPLPPSTRTSVDRQVPLRFVETGKSEDPKYHDNLEGIQICQTPLTMTRERL